MERMPKVPCIHYLAKPTKVGIKLYQVCEAKSGYCHGFDIYTGSTPCTQYAEALGVGDEATTTTRTVLGLLTRCEFTTRGTMCTWTTITYLQIYLKN